MPQGMKIDEAKLSQFAVYYVEFKTDVIQSQLITLVFYKAIRTAIMLNQSE